MKRLIRTVIALALVGSMSAPALAGPEGEPTALAMTGDLVVARPLGAVITTVGAAVFIASLPFTALGGNVSQSAETLVVGPAAETFMRCLGCKSSGRNNSSAR
jgi:hypothetical protein